MSDTVERLSPALAGHYLIDRKIGEGGMASVYLAQDVRHRRKVAIKVLHPELSAVLGSERFLQEIELTAGLQHPHILPLFDSGATEGLLYYVMPYVDGESLRARLTRERQLPVAEAVRIACDVAGALEFAHRRGVVHRDIKPENILLYEGRPVVSDFGIALAVASAGGTRMTQTGMSLGTPHYMAPEQAMGERDITPRSDIYALGAVLYEMLVGEPPFTGPTSQAIIARVVTEEPRSLVLQRKTIPPHVEAAVLTALAKVPADRFGTAAQFADALTRSDYVAPPTQRAAATPGRRGVRSRALTLLPWALLAVTAAALAFVTLRPAPRRVTRERVMLWRSSTPLNIVGRGLALSPDGRTIAFVDTVGGKQQIWLKDDSRLDPFPLAGTEDARSPTFSPDGFWIAFMSEGKVKKVPRLGGAAITLSDSARGPAEAPGSLTWLEGGTLLFTRAGRTLVTLSAVSENGGPHTQVFSDLTDTLDRGVVSLTGLPGGNAALVGTCDPGCTAPDLRRVDIRTGESHVLTEDALKGWYADGHLVFVRRDGAVFAAPWNPAHTRLQTAPVPVLDGVRTSVATADMALSDNGTLLYIAGPSQAGAIVEAVWVNRRGEVSPVDTGWTFALPPNGGIALSPDGRRLGLGARVSGAEDIWIKTLDAGPLTRLTFDGLNPRPKWTLDGSQVVYTSTRRGGNSDLRMRRADGTGAESTLVDLRRDIFEVEFTANTAELIVRLGQPPSRDIVLVRVGDTTVVPLAATPEHDEVGPALSPDGRWLAYASNETGRYEVYVRPFPDADAGKWQISRNGGTEAAWTRRGRELIYRDSDGLMAMTVEPGATFVTGEQRRLFATRGLRQFPVTRSYEVAPDGQRFLFMRFFNAPGEETLSPAIIVQNWTADMYRPSTR